MNINNNKIYSTPKYKINFKAIKLSEKELLESKKLLNQYIKAPNGELESLKNKIFNFFEIHLLEEINLKTKSYHIKQDFAQEMFLEFFLLLEKVREKILPKEEFIPSLDKIKPSKDALKNGIAEISINEVIGNSNIKIEDMLSEDNLPIYASVRTVEENMENINKLNSVVDKVNLSEREKEILKAYKESKKNRELAKELNLAESTISVNKKSFLLKLQDANGEPSLIKNIAKELKAKYKLETSEQDIFNSLIRKPNPILINRDELFNAISKTSELLNIEEKDFVKSIIRQPQILYIQPKEINERIEEFSRQCNIKKEAYVHAALKQPPLFCQNPQTLLKNVKESSKLFNISTDAFVKAALIQPALFFNTPESLYEKMSKSAAMFGTSVEKFIPLALKQPNLFYQKPETLYKNIEEFAKLINIDKDYLIKIALREPRLFILKPSYLYKNVEENAKQYNITNERFIRMALNFPAIFYQKPETLYKNIKHHAEVFNISFEKILEMVLKTPQLFSMKSESMYNNIQKASVLLDLKLEKMLDLALKNPILFYTKPETAKDKINLLRYIKQIKEEDYSVLNYTIKSNNVLYNEIVGILVKKHLKLYRLNKDLIHTLKMYPNQAYKFELPESEFNKEIIEHTKKIFKENQINSTFEFTIKK